MVANAMTTWVILGDVHGNARALRAALARARAHHFDAMVFTGDLLTYGHDVDEVLELVADAQAREGAIVIAGNHDRLYFELDDGDHARFAAWPKWIQESVTLTRTRLYGRRLRELLEWSDSYLDQGLLVQHATPYHPHDERYLVREVDEEPARAALRDHHAWVGVFGHTHRPRWCGLGPDAEPPLDTVLEARIEDGKPLLANAGSVGQPRDERARSLVLRVSRTEDKARAMFEAVDYAVDEHLAALRAEPLATATVERLCSFFRPRAFS